MNTLRELSISRTHLLRAAVEASAAGQEDLVKATMSLLVELNTLMAKLEKEPARSPVPTLQDNYGRTLVITDEA